MISLNDSERNELLSALNSSLDARKMVFEKAAELLAESMEHFDEEAMKNALLFNRQVWNTFQSLILEEALELSIDAKKNMLALSAFIEHRTDELLLKPDPERAKPIHNASLCLASELDE